MFYNVRLFLYTKLHVEMCLINFGIRYECKIGVRFVKEFYDTIRQNPFCRRILILKHKLWRCRSIKMRILIKKGFHHILHAFFFFCHNNFFLSIFSFFFWLLAHRWFLVWFSIGYFTIVFNKILPIKVCFLRQKNGKTSHCALCGNVELARILGIWESCPISIGFWSFVVSFLEM